MFKRLMFFLAPHLRELEKERKTKETTLAMSVMKFGRQADAVQEELSRRTLEVVAKG